MRTLARDASAVVQHANLDLAGFGATNRMTDPSSIWAFKRGTESGAAFTSNFPERSQGMEYLGRSKQVEGRADTFGGGVPVHMPGGSCLNCLRHERLKSI